MFFEIEKLSRRVDEIRNYIYRNVIEIESFKMKEDTEKLVFGSVPNITEFNEEFKKDDYWCGWDRYMWISRDIEVPKEWKDQIIVGYFDFGKTEGGTNAGFESLCYLNGKPYQGVDSNHKEIFIPSELAGTTINLTFRIWSGLSGQRYSVQEHKFRVAQICVLDKKVDDFYFTTKMVVDTLKLADKNSTDFYKLSIALNESYKLVDWREKGSEEFFESIYKANEFIQLAIDNMSKESGSKITCVGHTHIDVAWLWRLKHTREKAIRSFSTVIRLMERYPNYYFLQSQPQLYEFIKNDHPELYEDIKARIKEGKWEVDGGMWLEADCNIISGESMTRQILVGTNFVKDEFDETMNYLWLPDVFGYSWAMPQILRKAGLKTFVTSKISWNQYNSMPHDTFYWKGIDGTKILTYFITTSNYQHSANSIGTTYNGNIKADTVKYTWDNYKDKRLHNEVLIPYGHGDGGGGVEREMLESVEIANRMPLLSNVKAGRTKEFLDRVHEAIENTTEYVHEWDGELYLEYHRGTYTSQAHNKKMNRRLELLYRKTEMLKSIEVLESNWGVYPSDEFLSGWKIILRNQFHDIIPGSSIHDVYEDSRLEYEEAKNIAKALETKAIESLAKETGNNYFVLNTTSWDIDGVVKVYDNIDKSGNFYVEDKCVPSQLINDHYEILIDDIKGASFKNFRFVEEEREARVSKVDFIETKYYVIKWNDAGQLTSIFDKIEDREVLADKGNVFQVFEDKPMNYEAWDIDIYYQEKMRTIDDLVSINVSKGEIATVVNFCWRYGKSTINQEMVVYDNSPVIEFRTTVDWHQQQELLKVAFNVDIRATEATYQIQYGNVKRATNWNTSWDQAKFECVGHQWADMSESGYGVALLNDCKYGYDIKDKTIRLSLIKCAISPDATQDQGFHEFTYALLPHSGGFIEGKVEQEAFKLNEPLVAYSGEVNEKQLLKFSSDKIVLDAVKKAEKEDVLIVRFHDYTGTRQKVEIVTGFEYHSWCECDLLERPIEDMKTDEIKLIVKPYEIRTLYFKIK